MSIVNFLKGQNKQWQTLNVESLTMDVTQSTTLNVGQAGFDKPGDLSLTEATLSMEFDDNLKGILINEVTNNVWGLSGRNQTILGGGYLPLLEFNIGDGGGGLAVGNQLSFFVYDNSGIGDGEIQFRNSQSGAQNMSFKASGDTNTTWAVASDKRLKKDVKEIENACEKLKSLHPIHFKMMDNENISTGYIAKELQDAGFHE